MNDYEFLSEFEAATLRPFTHREHIRVAWLYLRNNDWDSGYQKIQSGIQHFATELGVADMYHETITCFWATLVQYCIDEKSDIADFEEFITTYPMLLEKATMMKYYSSELISSQQARKEWQEPDLIALPS